MEEINGTDYLKRENLLYWIDKWFVQEVSKQEIGRELNEDEIAHVTKSLEWGLWDSVYEVTKTAIDLATEKEN